MKLFDMPFQVPHLDRESDNEFDVWDKHFRLIVDRSEGGEAGKAAVHQKLFRKETVASELPDEQDDHGATRSLEEHRDIISWIPQGGDAAFVEISQLPGDRFWILVCHDQVTEASIMDLSGALVRAAVLPYAGHISRTEWKEARRPRMETITDWEPENGAFDVPIARYISKLTDSTTRRMNAMYDCVFARKLVSCARSAVSRWAKKNGLPVRLGAPVITPESDKVPKFE